MIFVEDIVTTQLLLLGQEEERQSGEVTGQNSGYEKDVDILILICRRIKITQSLPPSTLTQLS
jgi:hypothetical protein